MNIDDILSKYEEPTKNNPIMFNRKDGLDYNDVINRSVAPRGYGIYLILKKKELDYKNILYFGRAGTIRNDRVKGQTIRTRLKKKQNGDYRRISIPKMMEMEKEKIEDITIRCFITYDEERNLHHIPSFVEANLIQWYFETNKKQLPPWNKEY